METTKTKTRAKRKSPFDAAFSKIKATDFPASRWVARTPEGWRETLSARNIAGKPMYYVKGVPYPDFEDAVENFKVLCEYIGARLLTKEASK